MVKLILKIFLWGFVGIGLACSFLLIGQLSGGYLIGALLLSGIVFVVLLRRGSFKMAGVLSALSVMISVGWYLALEPSSDKDWVLDTSILPWVDRDGPTLKIEGFRDFRWNGEEVEEARWKNESFDLDRLSGLELIVEPFGDSELTAHVMVGFSFSDGRRFVVSVEARREKGEEYEFLAGAARQFELIYVFASEEDIIDFRAIQRKNRVYAYPMKVDRELMKNFLLELCTAANDLHETPRFYATLRDNCATTLIQRCNEVADVKLGFRYEVLFPAKLGELVYELGFMDTDLALDEVDEAFRVLGPRGL